MQDDLAHFSESLTQRCLALTAIETAASRQHAVSWSMLRLDLVDELISGNKAFKLLPVLQSAYEQGKTTLISFGGFHSNHIHALAAAGKRFGFTTVGIIRGYESQPLSPTLLDAQRFGMQLFFVGRQEYKLRNDIDYQKHWQQKFAHSLLIPEGAADALGLQGAKVLAQLIKSSLAPHAYDAICISAGTGSTAAGLIDSEHFKATPMYIFSALDKAALHQLPSELPDYVKVLDEYCGRGFAKTSDELMAFMVAFERCNSVLLDPVYTAKMCFGINDLIAQGQFKRGSHIVSVHTGGLQGRRGMNDKLRAFAEKEVGYES